ncbi:hypothetical protein COW81_01735 [Candidatus Campbellbacteria bacterium CG22_combo_CG10-13_8_21_14_all_36_13]|uniref:Small-conductance mechanosensitive ion channel n=1 Tax=Candidatus Campbellbacteria bacterium CG22_combo_CG10-13_8_21_14_all_36_13 TaxID=1974529 RepID=A0A2H0DYR5_9BACT|nr:MAG: hypothetical protein COW81_01735 [Candidatus Campbellbacteria bacterium CG22_combo_CG10-13_8_21_14_all_36_13]
MLINTWGDVLTRSFQDLWLGVVDFIPNFVVALIIFILGWVIGSVLGKAVAQIVGSLKLDNALRSAGFENTISRAGFKLNSGAFLGVLVKWFVIIVFLVASLDVLGLSQVNAFLQQVVLLFLPNVIVAVLIMLVAVVIADAMENMVIGSAKAAHVKSANFLGTLTRWAIWVFAALAALSQLGVATAFIQTLFTGVIIALALAFGLSFGIGGQKAAADYIEKLKKDLH